jgi:hypothetical protein
MGVSRGASVDRRACVLATCELSAVGCVPTFSRFDYEEGRRDQNAGCWHSRISAFQSCNYRMPRNTFQSCNYRMPRNTFQSCHYEHLENPSRMPRCVRIRITTHDLHVSFVGGHLFVQSAPFQQLKPKLGLVPKLTRAKTSVC